MKKGGCAFTVYSFMTATDNKKNKHILPTSAHTDHILDQKYLKCSTLNKASTYND